MIGKQDEQALERFFLALSQAMSDVALGELLAFYHVPCVFVSKEEKAVCSSAEQVTSRLTRLFEPCQKANAIKHNASVVHAMTLSNTILFATVDWQICNDKNDVKFCCSTSYTLERGGEFGFDIIVSVIDEEERALDNMCAQMTV